MSTVTLLWRSVLGSGRLLTLARRRPHGRPGHVQEDGVAVLDPATLDRLVTSGAIAEPPERLFDGSGFDLHGLPSKCDARVVPGIDRRHRVERRGELQRLTLFDDDIANVGCVDRLDSALPQRIVHRAWDETVRNVVQDLIAEPLADDLGRHLSRTEAWNPRRLAVVAGDLVDLSVDDGAGDFDDEILLRVADVDELGFHVLDDSRCRKEHSRLSLRLGGLSSRSSQQSRRAKAARLRSLASHTSFGEVAP